jgi:hypothetical protein
VVAGAVRTLAAVAFGAVIAQAAPSLQVPAWDQTIALLWGVGAILHAYAARATVPLLIGLGALAGWYLWEIPWDDEAWWLRRWLSAWARSWPWPPAPPRSGGSPASRPRGARQAH